jgi:hypothetical protein
MTLLPGDIYGTDTSLLAKDMAELFPEQAIILRATASPDGYGGKTDAWANMATVPCRYGPIAFRDQEEVVADRFRNRQLFRVAFPAGTDVRLTDRITAGALTLAVEGLRVPKSIEIERVAICVQAAT